MEPEILVFRFVTNKMIFGIIIELINNNPYPKLEVDMWIGSIYNSSVEVPHHININDDCYGNDTAIFRTEIDPFRTSEKIKIKVKTKLLYNDPVSVKLLIKD